MRKFIVALSLTIALAIAGTTPAAAANITVTNNTSVCGQVTVTAHGFGLWVGTSYQLVVSGSGPVTTTKTRIADSNNTITATFTLAEAGRTGQSTVRTASGGYMDVGFPPSYTIC